MFFVYTARIVHLAAVAAVTVAVAVDAATAVAIAVLTVVAPVAAVAAAIVAAVAEAIVAAIAAAVVVSAAAVSPLLAHLHDWLSSLPLISRHPRHYLITLLEWNLVETHA